MTTFRNVLIVGLLCVLNASTGWLAADKKTTVRLGTLAPSGSSFHQILLEMRDKWRQAPGGGVDLIIYPGGALGGEAAMVQKMNTKTIHAGMLSVVGLSEIDKSVTALQNLPLVFRSWEEVDAAREKLRPELEKRLLDKGFVVLFWGDAGWVRFFSKEPLTRPADLKRMKVFVWAGDIDQVDMMKDKGYQPVSLETNDILPSLQTGLISAVPLAPVIAVKSQIFKVAPYMLDLNWAPLVGATVISKSLWDTIPAATRDLLLKAANEAGGQIKARGRAESEESIAAMKKRGLKVQAVTPQIQVEWQKAVEEFYPLIRGKIVPADMFDKVQSFLQEYRASKSRPVQ